MRPIWKLLAASVGALLASPSLAETMHLPSDPHICVAPVLSGDADKPPFAAIGRDWPFFVPGHPTPLFRRDGPVQYFDADGRLRTHPDPEPGHWNDDFQGEDGDFYSLQIPDPDAPRLVFDRTLGHYREIRPDEDERRRQADRFFAQDDSAPRAADRPGRVNLSVHRSISSRDSGVTSEDPGFMTQLRSAETPRFHLRVETEGDVLRLARGDLSREIELPSVGYGGWTLTELVRSDRVLFQSRFGEKFFLIDLELNLTRPDGEWRLSAPDDVYFMPETGEALVTSLAALQYHRALFWLRDRRISGQDTCGDTAHPPVQDWRLVDFPGADIIDLERVGQDGRILWNGRSFVVPANNGTFEISLDGEIRKAEKRPWWHRLTSWWHQPIADVERDFTWRSWLEDETNPERWPGPEKLHEGWSNSERDKPYWWKVPRYGFAVRQEHRGRFVRLGPDLVPVMKPGQPKLPYASLNGFARLFDRGEGDVLAVDSTRRIIRIGPDGAFDPIDCAEFCSMGSIKAMVGDPGDPSAVLIGAMGGLFRHQPGRPLEPVVPVARTGPIFLVQTIPWLGEVVLEAGFGRFAWSRQKGLRWMGKSGGAYHPLELFLLPDERLVFSATLLPKRFEFLE